MADTQRTLTDLLTNLFQDGQSENSITPQDMRDLIYSMAPINGGLYISTPAVTSVAASSTYYKIAGTTTLIPDATSKFCDMPLDNRMRYTGTPSRNVLVEVTGDVSLAAGTNVELGFKIYKNGNPLDHTHTHMEIQSSGKPEQIAVRGMVEMATTDYVEVWAENATDTNNFTVNNMVMTLDGKFI